jgi:hypothetical protein
MKIEEFIEEYKKAKDKKSCLRKHVKREYVPFEEKVAECDKIIKSALHKKLDDGTTVFEVHSAIVDELFTLTVVKAYTDLEMADMLAAYNLIEENFIFDALSYVLDIERYRSVLDKMIADEREKNALVPFLDKQFEAFRMAFDEMKKGIK